MIAYIRKYFISGLLVWIPLWVTFVVVMFIVDLLSRSLLLLPAKYQPDALIGFHVPGIGVILTLLIIFLTGVFAANYIGGRLVDLGDSLMARIPLIRSIYPGVKKVTQTLFSPGGQSFRKVLLVQYPCEGVWSIAFQTGEVSKEIQGSGMSDEPMVCYFIPTTPNPTSGFLMMAPKSKVIELEMRGDQALKFVISLGVVQPIVSDLKIK